eukprot:9497154-Pyramimonas_sp.AAC.1
MLLWKPTALQWTVPMTALANQFPLPHPSENNLFHVPAEGHHARPELPEFRQGEEVVKHVVAIGVVVRRRVRVPVGRVYRLEHFVEFAEFVEDVEGCAMLILQGEQGPQPLDGVPQRRDVSVHSFLLGRLLAKIEGPVEEPVARAAGADSKHNDLFVRSPDACKLSWALHEEVNVVEKITEYLFRAEPRAVKTWDRANPQQQRLDVQVAQEGFGNLQDLRAHVLQVGIQVPEPAL